MKKLLKRFGAAFVIVAMLVAMIPMTVLADTYHANKFNFGHNKNYKEVKEGDNFQWDDDDKTIKFYIKEGNNYASQQFQYSTNGINWYNSNNNKQLTNQMCNIAKNNYVTIISTDVTNKKIILEKRTGVYVGDSNYDTTKETKDIVTSGNVLTLYAGTGKKLTEFKVKYNDSEYNSTDGKYIITQNKNYIIKEFDNEGTHFSITLIDAPITEITFVTRFGIAPANATIGHSGWGYDYVVDNNLTPTGAQKGLVFDCWCSDEGLNTPAVKKTSSQGENRLVVPNGVSTFYAKWKSTVTAPTPLDAEDLEYNPESDGNALFQAPAEAIEGTVVKYAIVEKPFWMVQDPIAPDDDSDAWVSYEAVKVNNAGNYLVFYKAFEGTGEDAMPASDVGYIVVKVTPRKVATPTALNPTYNGKEQPGVDFEATSISTTSDEVMQTNAGTYETVFSLDNELKPGGHINYVWADETEWPATVAPKTLSWSIEKRDVEENDFVLVTPDEEELGYTGEPVDIEAELKDINLDEFGDVALLVLDENGKKVNPEKVYRPGTYMVYAGVTGGDNFNVTTVGKEVYVGSFTIDGVKVVAGNKGKFTEGSDGTLTFKANGPFNEEAFKDVKTRTTSRYFNGIEIDGNTVDPKNYTVKAGSTVATLSNDYLKTLKAGKHTITFVYDGGNVTTEATFTVEATESPKTADANTTWLWILLGTLAGLALIAGAYKTIGSDL